MNGSALTAAAPEWESPEMAGARTARARGTFGLKSMLAGEVLRRGQEERYHEADIAQARKTKGEIEAERAEAERIRKDAEKKAKKKRTLAAAFEIGGQILGAALPVIGPVASVAGRIAGSAGSAYYGGGGEASAGLTGLATSLRSYQDIAARGAALRPTQRPGVAAPPDLWGDSAYEHDWRGDRRRWRPGG